MKRILIQSFAIIIIGGLLIASCKKDETTPANSFKYNAKESPIGTAFAGKLGQASAGSYGYYIYFLENTLTVNYVNSAPDSLSGVGDLLEIAMVSSDSTGIKPGTYNFSSSQITFDPFTFGYESGLLVNYDPNGQSNPAVLLINGGTITVSKSGDVYEFTLSMTTNANSTITGFYKGEIVFYEMGKKSSSNNLFTFPQLKK
jgi:hypothetical protein